MNNLPTAPLSQNCTTDEINKKFAPGLEFYRLPGIKLTSSPQLSLRFPPNSSFSQLTSNNVLLAVCILLLFQNSSLSPIQLTNSDLHYSVVCVNIISCSPNYNWLLQIEATNSSQLRNINLLQNFFIFLDFISVIVLEICINNSEHECYFW